MAEVHIACPVCKKVLMADDRYLRYTVSCFACHSTFIFNSILICNNEGMIPIFRPIDENVVYSDEKASDDDIAGYDVFSHGKLAKSVFTLALKNKLLR